MNIFFLHLNPEAAAKLHHDTHVISQIRESAELLSSCRLYFKTKNEPHAYLDSERVTSHMNHPCAIWVRESKEHYDWLYNLFTSLLHEYIARYGKTHSYDYYIDTLFDPPEDMPSPEFVSPPQVMPSEYQSGDAVIAYRDYYLGSKMKWANGRNNTYYKTGLTADRFTELLREIDEAYAIEWEE